MSLSKKLRFEVLKRDGFRCGYCGAEAPNVLLHVDHVVPRSAGGSDDILNLVTACAPCNLGKSDRQLSDHSVMKKTRNALDELQARREQLELMMAWQQGLLSLDSEIRSNAKTLWSQLIKHQKHHIPDQDRDLQQLIDKFGLPEVVECMKISIQQYGRTTKVGAYTSKSLDEAWSKITGIAYNRKRWKNNPRQEASDRGRRRFIYLFRSRCSRKYPEDRRLARWWDTHVSSQIPPDVTSEYTYQVAESLVDTIVREFKSHPSCSSYWSTVERLPGTDAFYDAVY